LLEYQHRSEEHRCYRTSGSVCVEQMMGSWASSIQDPSLLSIPRG
jgi:hypothetical protein